MVTNPPTISRVGVTKRRESEFPPTEESGLQTPPTRDITIGVTNPSHKRYKRIGVTNTRDTPIKESGLQTPPTRDTPIPIRDTPIKESGLQTPPTKDITPPTRDTHSGISNPPNRPLSEGRGLQEEVCKSSLTFSESGCAFRV